MKIFLISGKARSGKDTTASIIREYLDPNEQSSVIMHYADLLKYICRTFLGWDGKKDIRGRKLLQDVGTDIVRKKDPDFWVRFVVSIIGFFDTKWDFVIIPDVRFPNEINIIKNNFNNVIHINIDRGEFDNGLDESQKNHASENAINNISPDYIIYNHGNINDLNESVKNLLKQEALLND